MTFTAEVDVPVPMRDGVSLATNVWRPDGPGPFPALPVRTPYGKDDAGTYGNPKLPDVFALVAAGVTEAHLRFFDRWVRGRTETPDDAHRVRIFVMGIDRWRDEVDWPLPDTRYTDFFLTGGGRANTTGGEGDLVVAVNRVHHGPARPSRLVLPLIERAHTTEAEEPA